jgi:glutaredoxin
VKTIFELHHVIFYERDVSLHGEFLNELRDLTGEGVSVPRVFIKGRYIGGVDEVVELNESGRLGRILVWARVERVEGRQACVDVGMLGLCHVWNVVGFVRFWLMGSRRGVGSAMRMGWFVAQLVINEVFDFFLKKKTLWML